MTEQDFPAEKRLPGPSIPLRELVFCGDCLVAFSSREAGCPKCGAESGIWRLEPPRKEKR